MTLKIYQGRVRCICVCVPVDATPVCLDLDMEPSLQLCPSHDSNKKINGSPSDTFCTVLIFFLRVFCFCCRIMGIVAQFLFD